LIAHHEDPLQAIETMKFTDRIAVGWSEIGDLRNSPPHDASDIADRIRVSYPKLDNSQLGGPSLWNLLAMREGDLVIVNGHGKRQCVFEITGPYFFAKDEDGILDYHHQRRAVLTEIDADSLWTANGGVVADGQNIRWTLVRCFSTEQSAEIVLREGARFEVQTTAIERNPLARAASIKEFGCRCFACKFDFEAIYGELGRGYIHVHHRTPLASHDGEHDVVPKRDLVPLCPNCHAMVHRTNPPLAVEELITLLGRG
jgi:hypothetical protein